MLVGAFYFPTDYGIDISELAQALEACGFESLFVCEHTHIPVSRRTPLRAAASSLRWAAAGTWRRWKITAHYDTRFKLLRERVLAMKALWTQEEVEFHGEFVNFDPVWLHPKPKQKPHPPLFLGGETDHTLKRVVEFCDSWFPRAWGNWDPKTAVARLRQAAIAAGRDPATRSRCSMPQPTRRRLRRIARPASSARCWRCRT